VEFEVGSQVPDAVLLGESEREMSLAELCADGPAVLFFLRHFG
jgi:hypothetical protein